MAVIQNGVQYQTNLNISAALRDYFSAQFTSMGNLLATAASSSNLTLRQSYYRINARINNNVNSWVAAHGNNRNDSNLYQDPVVGLPYRRSGVILIVVGDRAPALGGRSRHVQSATFDPLYNRIIVSPVYLRGLAHGRIQQLSANGTWVTARLDAMLVHEIGHRGEPLAPTGLITLETANRYRNAGVDVESEIFEETVLRAAGRTPRLPHSTDANGNIRVRYLDRNGNPLPHTTEGFRQYLRDLPEYVATSAETGVLRGVDGNFYGVDAEGYTQRISAAPGTIGRLAASSLGNFLTKGDNVVVQLAVSTALGSIGEAFGNALSINAATTDLSASFEAAFQDFDQTVFNNLKAAAVGSLSSFTAMELGRVLGLAGFGGELFNAAAGAAVAPIYDKVLTNITSGYGPFENFNLDRIFGGASGFGDVVGGGVASFLGAKLGSLVVSPTSTAGAALASLGSATGAYALSASGSSALGGLAAQLFGRLGILANVAGPGIGSFVGFVLGSLVGRVFGRRKPRIPEAGAEVVLGLDSTQYALGAVTASNSGNRGFVTAMATSARDTLNGVIGEFVGGSVLRNANTASPTQTYGHYGNQVRANFMGGAWQSFNSADAAVDWGVVNAVRATKIRGGNLILKRVMNSSTVDSVTSLLGNLQLASDYYLYLLNRELINNMIRQDPRGEIAAAWIVTLGRANELGLNRFAPSDFYGGLKGFSDSFGFGGNGSFAYENIALSFEGVSLRITARDGAPLFDLFAASNNVAAADAAKSALIPNFHASTGYTYWQGSATAGNDIALAGASPGAVTLDDSADGGDDIFAGSAFNDHLYGRSGYDWLDGGAGHDWIEGGAHQDVLLGSAGVDLLIGGDGDDYLAGGDGHEYPAHWRYGQPSEGGLYGGAGNDVLVGGEGSDFLTGDDGDDVLMVDDDAHFGWQWDELWGGAGSDTASFERFGYAVSVNMANGKDGWRRKRTDARRSEQRTVTRAAQNRRAQRGVARRRRQYGGPRFVPRASFLPMAAGASRRAR